MQRPFLLALAASLLTFSAVQAQTATKIKTKTKVADGPTVKNKVEPLILDGPIKRVETLSGIDIFPASGGKSIMLSFTQQFTQPGTLTVTNYKKQAIYATALDPQTNTGTPVDLGRIPAGNYLVEAKTGNYVYWKKVMVRYPAAPVARKSGVNCGPGAARLAGRATYKGSEVVWASELYVFGGLDRAALFSTSAMNSVSRFSRLVAVFGLLLGLVAFAGPGLKKTVIAKNLTMGVPDGFAPLPDDGIAAKYPAQRRPLAVFASPNGQVGLSVTQKATNFSNRDYALLLKIYKASIQNMYGKVQFLREDIHTVNKRDFVVLEFVSTVADNRRGGNLAPIRKYQLVQYAIEGEQLYVFTFDAPAQEQAKWQPIAQAAMESVVMK